MYVSITALDKKNLGDSIRCTIVTDIGVFVTNPQFVDKVQSSEFIIAKKTGKPAGIAL